MINTCFDFEKILNEFKDVNLKLKEKGVSIRAITWDEELEIFTITLKDGEGLLYLYEK